MNTEDRESPKATEKEAEWLFLSVIYGLIWQGWALDEGKMVNSLDHKNWNGLLDKKHSTIPEANSTSDFSVEFILSSFYRNIE